jgi:predicted nucleic acid-binding protein
MVIDSSIFIEYLRAKDKKSASLFQILDEETLFISSVTLYELFIGATNETKWNDIMVLTEDLTVLPFSDEVAIEAARIYHNLKKANTMIEFRDIFIAATCKAYNLPIKTLNKNDFKRVPGLKVID